MIVVDVTTPLLSVAVAVAVVPTPTGGAILITILPEYPEPALDVVNPVTTPEDDTVAVKAAPTPIFPDDIKASTLLSPD